MAQQNDTLYGVYDNTVDWNTLGNHTHIQSLSGSINRMMTVTRPASGAVDNGMVVVLNDNGTVSIPDRTPDTVSDPISGGSYEGIDYNTVYDPDSQSIIMAYQQNLTSSRTLKIVTLTPSSTGDSIIFGVPNTLKSTYDINYNMISLDYDTTNNKIVLVWGEPYTVLTEGQYMVVGEVISDVNPANKSISFGAPVYIGDDPGTNASSSVAYDSANNISVITRSDDTDIKSMPVTVSGMSLISGVEENIGSASREIKSLYHPTSGKIVLCYMPSDYYFYSMVGTVTATGAASAASISWGTPDLISLDELTIDTGTKMAYDSINDRFIACWMVNNYINVSAGEVIGDSITWSEKTSIYIGVTSGYQRLSISFDSTKRNFVITYRNPDGYIGLVVGSYNIRTGKAHIWDNTIISSEITRPQPIHTSYYPPTGEHIITYDIDTDNLYHRLINIVLSTNIVTDNFLGISQGSAGNGEDCVIGRYGFIAENLSVLVPNTHYYSDAVGNIVTYDTQGPYIGYAITESKFLIKG